LLEKGGIKSVGDSFSRKTSGNKKAHGLVKKIFFTDPQAQIYLIVTFNNIPRY